MRRLAWELFGYGAASAIALGADAGLLFVLATRLGWDYRLASAVSFLTGAVIAYGLSVAFVFANHRVRNRKAEFTYFVLLGLVGLVVNSMVIIFAVGTLGLKLLVAKAMAAVCTFVTNFALRRHFLFRAGAPAL